MPNAFAVCAAQQHAGKASRAAGAWAHLKLLFLKSSNNHPLSSPCLLFPPFPSPPLPSPLPQGKFFPFPLLSFLSEQQTAEEHVLMITRTRSAASSMSLQSLPAGLFKIARQMYLLFQQQTTIERAAGDNGMWGPLSEDDPTHLKAWSLLRMFGPTTCLVAPDSRAGQLTQKLDVFC